MENNYGGLPPQNQSVDWSYATSNPTKRNAEGRIINPYTGNVIPTAAELGVTGPATGYSATQTTPLNPNSLKGWQLPEVAGPQTTPLNPNSLQNWSIGGATTPTVNSSMPSFAPQAGIDTWGVGSPGATSNLPNAATAAATTSGFSWDEFAGGVLGDGRGGFDWDVASNIGQVGLGLWQGYQGMQKLDLAKDQFNFQKNAWQEDFNMRRDAYDTARANNDSRNAALSR